MDEAAARKRLVPFSQNASLADIGAHKVEMFAAAIQRYRPDCEVVPLPSSIATHEAILAASESAALGALRRPTSAGDADTELLLPPSHPCVPASRGRTPAEVGGAIEGRRTGLF